MTTSTVQTTPKRQRRKASTPIDWASYNKALVRRGNITLWFSEDAVQAWYSSREGKPGGQRKYSDLAIETSLTLRLVFKQALRQTEGFVQSLIVLMNVDLQAPDHSTLSRRAKNLDVSKPVNLIGESITVVVDSTGLKVCGQGEWDATKHGQKGRRRWRKLHLCINEGTLDILSHSLTTQEIGDSTAVPGLLDEVNAPIDEFLGDGAYDGRPVYDRVENHDAGGQREITVPPHSNAKPSENFKTNPTKRDIHVDYINTKGRFSWEYHVNYRRRLTVENAVYRYKTIIGRHMHSRKVTNQKTEAAIGCNILNRMAEIGMPQSNLKC